MTTKAEMRSDGQPVDKLTLTIPEAAGSLSICKRTLERLMASGAFPRPLKIGRSSRVLLSDVHTYLQRLDAQRNGNGGTR